MKRLNKAGFTIIETVLFLGITGLLVVGVLVGTGVSINIQRYRDSVVSLQSVIQQQYSEAADVVNMRGSGKTCNDDGSITDSAGGSTENRGQSDCVILGRIITPTNANYRLATASVVGVLPDVNAYQTDADLLANAHLKIMTGTEDSYILDWGARTVSVGGAIKPFTILIIRSPISGNIKTFINNSEYVNLNNVDAGSKLFNVTDPSKTGDLKMCVEDNGLTSQSRMAVYLTSATTSASGVEVLGGESSGCGA
jgi:type II secretory pathway pseudopilin PulG